MSLLEQIKSEVLAEIDANANQAVSTFREFVQIPCIYKDVAALKRASEFIADVLIASGVDTNLIESGTPEKMSVLGRLPGAKPGAGKSLILNGHMDIYPPSKSWTMEPFAGIVRNGRMYGQGTDDMKAGILAMALAMAYLARSKVELCGDLYLHAIPNHYNGGDGTRNAVSSGLRADFAIVGEPSGLNLAVAQCGILYVNVVIRGVSTHGTAQDLGVHPVSHAAKLIEALNDIQFPSADKDPHRGSCHLNISALHAEGLHRSLVPDECVLTADIRFTPSLGREGAYRAVEQIIEQYGKSDDRLHIDLKVDPTCLRNPRHATAVSPDAPISKVVARSAAQILGRPSDIICHPAWPDTPVFNDMGIQAVTFGPGPTTCYWPDEYVEIADFISGIKIYALAALDACRCTATQ